MKEENEKILKFWRQVGYLNGLKEGSQNEWRCAKSFDLLYKYICSKNNTTQDYDVNKIFDNSWAHTRGYCMPIIRRVICKERPRVNRIVKPNEIIDPLVSVKLRDLFDIIPEKNKKKKSYKTIYKIFDYYRLFDENIATILYIFAGLNFVAINFMKDVHLDAPMLRKVFDIDLEAEIIALYSKYLAIKLNEKKMKTESN